MTAHFVVESPIRTSVWCSPAGGLFFPEKMSLVFCNLKQCFLHSTRTIFNGTRLDRRGLKNEIVRFQDGTKLMARNLKQIETKHGLPLHGVTPSPDMALDSENHVLRDVAGMS